MLCCGNVRCSDAVRCDIDALLFYLIPHQSWMYRMIVWGWVLRIPFPTLPCNIPFPMFCLFFKKKTIRFHSGQKGYVQAGCCPPVDSSAFLKTITWVIVLGRLVMRESTCEARILKKLPLMQWLGMFVCLFTCMEYMFAYTHFRVQEGIFGRHTVSCGHLRAETFMMLRRWTAIAVRSNNTSLL